MDNQQNSSNQAGKTSWEEQDVPFFENLKKNWRKFLPRCFGPVGSMIFHILLLATLVSLTTTTVTSYIETKQVEIPIINKPEPIEEKPIKTIEQKQDQEIIENQNHNINNIGISLVPPNDPIGGADNKLEDTGIGTGEKLINKDFEIDVTSKSRLTLKGLTYQRSSGGIKGALNEFGGNGGATPKETEQAVLKALRWLKKEQLSDGSWKGTTPPAMTSFALLAYLAHGETSSSIEFGPTVKNAITYLINSQEQNGHFKGKDSNNYSQPIVAYALCEAFALINHPDIKYVAIKAINEIVNGQHQSGGFNYSLNQDNREDSSYMAWCCQALKAAKMAKLTDDVPALDASIKKAIKGFKLNADPYGGFGYASKGKTGLSGAGALCLQLLGNPKATEVSQTIKFLETCTFSFDKPDQQPYSGTSHIYYWYYITQAKFHHSPETFSSWNKLFSPELCKKQIIEKNAIQDPSGKLVDIGHWESPSKGEHTGGIVQDTALCTLMLEVYYRYLPTFKQTKEDDIIIAKKEDIFISIK
jgi:hypothetical protein